MYRVKDVMTDEVLTCRLEDTLEAAVQIMWDRGCGCVPVIGEGERVLALLTDRDAVMCALRLGKRLAEIQVEEACSRNVITCRAEDTIERAEMLMRLNRVRRLPVIDEERTLVGVVSLTDLARYAELVQMADRSGLTPGHIGAVLAETSRVRAAPRRDHVTRPPTVVESFFHG